jgi:hypothetical protein
MKIASVREFRDKATQMFRSKEPILVLKRGELAGLYFPYPHKTLPLEFKQELFDEITHSIAARLARAGLSEEEILGDFEAHQKARRRR